MTIRERVVEYINSKDYKPSSREQLLAHFDIELAYKNEFYQVLKSLEQEGLIIQNGKNKYCPINASYHFTGILQGHERGFGFVLSGDRDKEDLFIPADAMAGAMNGDKVIANIEKAAQPNSRAEGSIIKILERANEFIVGTFEESRDFAFVIPDNRKIYNDVFIAREDFAGAKNKQKVVVRISKWPEARKNPEGKVIEILGYMGDKGTDILSVIRNFNLPEEFPKKVRNLASEISLSISPQELEGRTDLRDLKTFTIDGADAKDLDDAISMEKLDNGNYQLGVHIADVSHYVKEHSILDKEAQKRGNSVYLIDRVIPMLPKELSNGICSLNPNQDRLTLSVLMEINKTGKVVKHQILESVINSKARLIYDDVSDFLEDKDSVATEKVQGLEEALSLMEELMKILYKKREARGSIDFNFPESRIILDEETGRPLEIIKEDRRASNRMIEEFMLVTNETVAEEFYWTEVPFLYRIHEDPDQEKLMAFAKFIHNFGYGLKGQEIHPKELQLLTKEIAGKKEEMVISTLLLRSLKKAKYSAQAGSHFGLASQYYSHFTAPIRRYSDLVIHRIIKEYLRGRLTAKKQQALEAILPDIAEHTSFTERRAEEAEREVDNMKKAQYMSERIGEVYPGIISSLTNFGIFVQLENTIEGLVHFNDMSDDYYHFDEDNYIVRGERSKKLYSLGDSVKVEVIAADPTRRSIDFKFLK